jgi:hypothetical protein
MYRSLTPTCQDVIADDPDIDSCGAMLLPIVLGADKTTVSVATGHTEYHPLYISPGNLHNDMRRAHRDSVIPLAFLAIPKCTSGYVQSLAQALTYDAAEREFKDNREYRVFRKQLYHASIAAILEPLRQGMTQPHILRTPDGHYRRALFEIGPFIADYPEQVLLAGIVQGWCPKYAVFSCSPDLSYQPHIMQMRRISRRA